MHTSWYGERWGTFMERYIHVHVARGRLLLVNRYPSLTYLLLIVYNMSERLTADIQRMMNGCLAHAAR